MMDAQQFRALVRVARDRRGRAAERDAFMLWLFGRTGVRVSEGLALRVEDCVLNASPPLLRVRTLKQQRTRQTWDDVYLEERVARQVRRWIDRTLPRILERQVQPADPLIPAAFGMYEPGFMSRRNATRIFRFYARRAQLPAGITLHSLRHYRGSTLYDTTKDLEFTREQLRHARLSSTQTYLHNSPAKVRRYLDELEEELG